MEHVGFGAGWYASLAREARRRGIQVATADMYRALALEMLDILEEALR